MKKIKVLHSGETTGALSGFGKYGREVLTRLADNDKLEIAEIAGFGAIEDTNNSHVKWKWYATAVNPGHPEHAIFDATDKFGGWRFERICLDFKPDHVFTIRDPWNDTFVSNSPFRPFFHFSWMPTVDSAPQQPQWIEMFRDCDSIFTYSDWAIPVLNKQSGGAIKPICSAYPGVDLKIYKPMDKIAIRKEMGLPEDAYIIGTTMRNQPRKLFAELFKAFRIYLDKYGHTDIGKNTYLYLHTSYPDVGWDLPDLLNEFGVTNRVYFSYICATTKVPLCFKFNGPGTHCKITNANSAIIPSVRIGYTEEQLARIYNVFDLYIQYANCEGLGMGQPEAAACGVVVASTDYSAMADIVEKTGGIALRPAAIPRDQMMRADRAIPDNDFTADAIYKFFCLDKKYRERKSKQTRQVAEKYFDWDRTAKIWSDHFENTKLVGLQGRWDSPLQVQNFDLPQPPPNLSNLEFVQWCASYVAKRPELATKHIGIDLLSRLNKAPHVIPSMGALNHQQVYDIFKTFGQNRIYAERARCGIDTMGIQDFIEYAHFMGNR
jgi:glycosyltransferase involved in cell wall biosynthesis